jgi:MFS family permease
MIIGGRVRVKATGRALRHRNFRFFFYGQLVSVTGTWMQTTAQAWLVLTLVGKDQAAFYLGLLGAVQFLPVLILGLFGGMIADLWPKRRTVVGTQVAAGLLALALAGLDQFGVVQVWHIFALGLALGVVNAVDMPTRQSFVVEMVGHDDVANAVGLNSAVFNGSRIIGPAVAGILVAVVGTASCFFLNAVSYVAVVVGLLMMRDAELMPAERLAMPRSASAVRENLAEGLVYVRRTPIVLLVVVTVGVVSTFGMNFNVILPAVAAGVLGVGSVGFGLLTAAMGIGALIAALIVAAGERPRIGMLVSGAILLGVAEIALSATTVFPIALTVVFLAGLGAVAMAATANSLIQVNVPGPLRGRVMSVYTTVFIGSTPAGNTMTGAMAGGFGTPVAVFVDGFVSVIAGVVAAIAVVRGRVSEAADRRRSARASSRSGRCRAPARSRWRGGVRNPGPRRCVWRRASSRRCAAPCVAGRRHGRVPGRPRSEPDLCRGPGGPCRPPAS